MRPVNMRGALGVPPGETNVALTDLFSGILGTATVPNPFSYTYVNITNILAWNAGAATTPGMFVGAKGNYRKARVTRFSLEVSACNLEAYPVELSITPVNFLPPNTLAQNQSNVKNGKARRIALSPKGGMDRGVVRYSGNTQSVGGFSYQFGVEDPLVFNTDGSSPPADNIYFAVNIDTAGLAAISGVTLWIRPKFWLDFFEPQTN